jgi:CBS-domain-containing membrane protein
MKAADIMTLNPITVEPNASVMQAVRRMLQHRISGLPVVDTMDNLVGIVTEGDLLRRAETGTQRRRPRWLEFLIGPGRMANEYAHACGRKVHEVMSDNVRTIAEDSPLDEIVQIMETHQVKRLPVMRGERLVGIVSRANLLRALASFYRDAKPSSLDDTTIRTKLLEELNKQSWAPVSLINVIVRNGVVHLWGALMDERQRQGIRVVAENTPGVKSVQDHLVWIEPTTGMTFPAPDEKAAADEDRLQSRTS